MKPKPSPIKDKQGHLFKTELVRIINKAHPMVKLADALTGIDSKRSLVKAIVLILEDLQLVPD